MRRAASRWAIVFLLVVTALSACGAGGNKKPVALTSFYPLYFLTAAIAGDRMEVRNLVPAGAEPHDWEPGTRDTAALKGARVFAYNGAGFEAWAAKALDAAPSKTRVAIEATSGLSLLPPPGEEGAAFPNDPHVWLDPVLAKEMARKIADGLTQADPDGRAVYAQNLATLQGRLDRLDAGFKAGLGTCARKEIVTSHAAFGYLARRYGLEQIAVEGLAPDAEPTPARIAAVAETARARGATHIFFETLVSPRVAETIAREIGAQTLVLDPLEGLREEGGQGPGQGQQDYFSVMNDNLANLRTALGCR
jgi:zinc transport system substrate-binding protein